MISDLQASTRGYLLQAVQRVTPTAPEIIERITAAELKSLEAAEN
jgi:hypothetical protein